MPTLEDLLISPDGIAPRDGAGALQIGAPVPTDSPLIVFDASQCLEDVPPGLWIANYPDIAFGFTVVDGTVVRIDIESPVLVTDTGIHLGSTLDELEAAYPGGFSQVVEKSGARAYAVEGERGSVRFTVGLDSSTVDFIRIYPIAQEVGPALANGNVAGRCQVGGP